jgi:hypothetical protein
MTIGIAKTEHPEDDERDEYGLPHLEITAHERSNQTTHVDQSINKALPYVAFSWFLAGGALIGVFLLAMLMPHIIDAKVKAGSAAAEERARTAEVNARVALDKVEDFRAKLAEKGININLDGH